MRDYVIVLYAAVDVGWILVELLLSLFEHERVHANAIAEEGFAQLVLEFPCFYEFLEFAEIGGGNLRQWPLSASFFAGASG